jgi:hypothetical protein
MPILNIRHVTTYRYHQPVAFGAHRMMLRPRDDEDQKVLESELEITPKPLRLIGIAFRSAVGASKTPIKRSDPASFIDECALSKRHVA